MMKIRRIDKSIPLPVYGDGHACFGLTCRESKTIEPGDIGIVPVNIVVQVPEGHALLVFVRSSTPIRKGLVLANGVGVIDPFFCGQDDEIIIELLNITKDKVTVEKGETLAQAMLVKRGQVNWEEIDQMPEKGEGGYWTTKED